MAICFTSDVRRNVLEFSDEIDTAAATLGVSAYKLLKRIQTASQDRLQARLRTVLGSRRIMAKPESSYTLGVDYDEEEPGYDYDVQSAPRDRLIRLRRRPVTAINRIRLVWGKAPGVQVCSFNTAYCEIEKWAGDLVLRRGYENLWGITVNEFFSNVLDSTYYGMAVPNLVCVDYTAGLDLDLHEGSLDSITVTDGGSGYTAATVAITGDGSGATAEAVVESGIVTQINITAAGKDYTAAPTIAINGDGSDATATAALIDDWEWPEDDYGELRELAAKSAAYEILPSLFGIWRKNRGLTGAQSYSISAEGGSESRSMYDLYNNLMKNLQTDIDAAVSAWVGAKVPYAMDVV